MEFDTEFYWNEAKNGVRLFDNFAWFGCDAIGHGAVFFSGGCGPIPTQSFASKEAYFEFYFGLVGELMSDADFANSGFFVFTYDPAGQYERNRPYTRVAIPSTPLTTLIPRKLSVELPSLNFADAPEIVVEEHFEDLNV